LLMFDLLWTDANACAAARYVHPTMTKCAALETIFVAVVPDAGVYRAASDHRKDGLAAGW